MKTKLIVILAIAAATVSVIFFNLPKPVAETDNGPQKVRKTAQINALKRAKTNTRAKVEKKETKKKRIFSNVAEFDDAEHPYSPEDKKLSKDLQDALDNVDDTDDEDSDDPQEVHRAKASRARLFALAAKACKSSNPSVRRHGIDAYSWEGKEALSELTPMMADPDEEVAEAAIDAVEQALNEQDNANLRLEAAAAYLKTFSVNEDALTMLGSTFSAAALELVDPANDTPAAELAAAENRTFVVELLTDMIDNGSAKCAAAAREAYNDITSEDWISPAEAQRWAQDPDNYEPLNAGF